VGDCPGLLDSCVWAQRPSNAIAGTQAPRGRGFDKTRYRSIAKNLARAQTMFALGNLYAVRHQLLPPGARCVL